MGAVHNDVLLPREEAKAAKALGLTVEDRGKSVFLLPCPRLSGTRCSVYDRRPSPCRRYRCQLLRHLDAGEIEIEDAVGKVRIARNLVEKAAEALPRGMTLPEARAEVVGRQYQSMNQGAGLSVEARLSIVALLDYIDRYFMNDDDGKYFESSFVGEYRPTGSK
jgi:Fe-S-cluster containining protein